MTDITTPNASNQPGADAVPANLPAGVSIDQYNEALADAQARGLIGPVENEPTKFEAGAIAAFPEVTSTTEYQLHEFPVDISDGDEAGSMAFDVQRREWLAAGHFPAEHGRSLIAAVADAEKRLANLTPEARELQIRTARGQLARLWGEKADANIALANRFLDYIEQRVPGAVAYLDASGAANDPAVIAQVFMQAERYLATGGRL